MKKYFCLICIFCVFICNFVQAATISNFENVTEKAGNVIVVKKGTIIEYNQDGVKLSVDNSKVAAVEGNKIKILDSGRFNVTVENGSKTSYQFFSWNTYLKSGRFFTYNDAKKTSKTEILYSKTYLDVTEINSSTLKIDDYVFITGTYDGELKGKYLTSYYDKSKDTSTSKYYEYAMKSNLKVTEPPKEEHTHKFEKMIKVEQEATCEKNGVKVYKCTGCDATKKVEQSKLGHTYKIQRKDENNHQKVCNRCGNIAGLEKHTFNKEGKCTICGYVKKVHTHNFEKLLRVEQKATCDKNGIKIYQCTGCDVTKKVEETKLGHNYKIQNKDENNHQKICSRCGNVAGIEKHTFNSEGKCTICAHKIVVHEHRFEKLLKVEQKATCDKKEIRVYQCVECDVTKKIEWPKLEHIYKIQKKDKNEHQKACTLCGKVAGSEKHTFNKERKCTVCGYVEVVQEHTHKFEKLFKVEQEATCDKKGIKVYQCTNCDVIKKVEVSELGHSYKIQKKDEDKHHNVCSRCGKTTGSEKHEFDSKGKCNICGYTEIIHEHKFEKLFKVEQEATCEKKGIKIYQCTGCDVTKEVEVSKLGHNYKILIKDEDKHHKVCNRCENTTGSEKHEFDNKGKCDICGYTKAAHEHKFEKFLKIEQEATCEKKGKKIYQCTGCDVTKKVEVSKLGHNYKIQMRDDSKHHKVCSRCEKTTGSEKHKFDSNGRCSACGYIKHEHKFEKLFEIVQEATCEKKGKKIYQCTGCDVTKKIEEPKLEHVYTIKIKDENKHHKVCNGCGKTTGSEKHKFDSNGKCSDCGYTINIQQNSIEYWKALQRHLKALGYYKDDIDGVFGKNTRNAINEVLTRNNFGRTLSSNAKWKDVDVEMYNFIMAQPIPPTPLRISKTAEETGNWDQTWLYHDNKDSDIKVKAIIIYLHGRDNNGTYGHPLVYDRLNMPRDVVLVCPILRDGWDNFFDRSGGTTLEERGTTKIERLMDQVSAAYPGAAIILEGHSMSTKFLGYMIEKNNPRIDGYAFYSPNWKVTPANNIKNCFVSRAYDEEEYERKYMKNFYSNPENNNVKYIAPKAVAKTHGAAPKIMTTDVHWDWVRNVIESKAK